MATKSSWSNHFRRPNRSVSSRSRATAGGASDSDTSQAAAACDPAKQTRVAPRGDCAKPCLRHPAASSHEGVNHFSAGHFLTRHSQPDCGGEGTPRLSPCFGRLWGSRGWSPGPQSISPNSDAAVSRLLCREAFHRVMAPSPSFSVASAMPTGGTGNGADQ